jgi:mevalonate kinase
MAKAAHKASAPGKAILLGEHAVVYGQPAIAVPVSDLRATASVEPAEAGSGLTIVALDIDESTTLASGLGSGAAVSTAMVRALAGFLGLSLTAEDVSALVFEVERIHHGTPSGIDNTVVAYEQPLYFVSGQPPERIDVGLPFSLLIADSGTPSSTREVVADVRQAWEADPARCDALFDQIGETVNSARRALEAGDTQELGALMDQNQDLLCKLGVSSRSLDHLVEAARLADAFGAKLSGAGAGGSMIALVDEELADDVAQALTRAGARKVFRTTLEASG